MPSSPGARTAWHTHPLGQTLVVTAGCGWAQREVGPKEEIRPGDVIWFSPGEKHWHGATATTAMTHIAVQEKRDGKAVEWMEKGKVYKVTLQPLNTSNYFAPGHRLRIEVSSSNFPRFDRNLNTGGNNYDESKGVVANNKVHHSKQYPSSITITVVKPGVSTSAEVRR